MEDHYTIFFSQFPPNTRIEFRVVGVSHQDSTRSSFSSLVSWKVIKVDSQKDESICIPRYCIFMVS